MYRTYFAVGTFLLVACNSTDSPTPNPTNGIDLKNQNVNYTGGPTMGGECGGHDFTSDVGKIGGVDIYYDEDSATYKINWGSFEKKDGCADDTSPDCYEVVMLSSNVTILSSDQVTNLEETLNTIPEPIQENKCSVSPCIQQTITSGLLATLYADGCDVGGMDYATQVKDATNMILDLVPGNLPRF